MQKYRRLTRWIQNAFERHFIRTYPCCIQMISGKVCLYDSALGNLNIQLRMPVNPWHTFSNSSDTRSLKTNLIKQICYHFFLLTHIIYLNNNMQHDRACLLKHFTNLEHLNIWTNTATAICFQIAARHCLNLGNRKLCQLTQSLTLKASDGSLISGERYWPWKQQAPGNTRGNRWDNILWGKIWSVFPALRCKKCEWTLLFELGLCLNRN